jgi:hypothetical protein
MVSVPSANDDALEALAFNGAVDAADIPNSNAHIGTTHQ